MHEYRAALQSDQRALAIRIKLFGEEHESTDDSYMELGIAQHEMHDYKAALLSHLGSLDMIDISRKLFGEQHESNDDSCKTLGRAQHEMHDYKAQVAQAHYESPEQHYPT